MRWPFIFLAATVFVSGCIKKEPTTSRAKEMYAGFQGYPVEPGFKSELKVLMPDPLNYSTKRNIAEKFTTDTQMRSSDPSLNESSVVSILKEGLESNTCTNGALDSTIFEAKKLLFDIKGPDGPVEFNLLPSSITVTFKSSGEIIKVAGVEKVKKTLAKELPKPVLEKFAPMLEPKDLIMLSKNNFNFLIYDVIKKFSLGGTKHTVDLKHPTKNEIYNLIYSFEGWTNSKIKPFAVFSVLGVIDSNKSFPFAAKLVFDPEARRFIHFKSIFENSQVVKNKTTSAGIKPISIESTIKITGETTYSRIE